VAETLVFGLLTIVSSLVIGGVISYANREAVKGMTFAVNANTDAMMRMLVVAWEGLTPDDVVVQPAVVEETPSDVWLNDLADPDMSTDWTDEPHIGQVFRGQLDELEPLDPSIGRPDLSGEL
jgi:hypothetical protein